MSGSICIAELSCKGTHFHEHPSQRILLKVKEILQLYSGCLCSTERRTAMRQGCREKRKKMTYKRNFKMLSTIYNLQKQ